MQLFGCPSTWSARAHPFYSSKLSLLLAGRWHVERLGSAVLKGL